MSEPAGVRPFLRLVVGCAILANGVAALVVQGERDIRPFRVAVVLDRDRLVLSDEIGAYGAAVESLRLRVHGDGQP